MSNKFLDQLSSKGFLVSVLTLLFMWLGSNQIFLEFTPEELAEKLTSGGDVFNLLLTVIVPNAVAIIIKVVQRLLKGELSFHVFNDVGTIIQIVTVVLLGINIFLPVHFPETAPTELVSAWDNGFISFLTALVINIINPIWQFLRGNKIIVVKKGLGY